MAEAELEALRAKHLCHQCVGEDYFSSEIRITGSTRRCSYCGTKRKAYALADVATRIAAVFDEHYYRTADQPEGFELSLLADKESAYEWTREGQRVVEAIAEAAGINEAVAADIQKILEKENAGFDQNALGEESEFAAESYYEEKVASDEQWQVEWNKFERSLKTEARFFSRSAEAHLASIFDGIERMVTRDGRPLLLDGGPNTGVTAFFRARSFQADDKIKTALGRPDIHIGSPPALLANAGRMNARGISVFYGASDLKVAIAEVRPPVGSRVVTARFDILKPIRLIDLTALGQMDTTGSKFDPQFARDLERATFLRSLSKRMTRPVMPDDEAFDYLATQAVADFLATNASVAIDGILFPSAQVTGEAVNVVLFHKSAKVEQRDLAPGTTLDVSFGEWYEDGWEDRYSVTEEVPTMVDTPLAASSSPWRADGEASTGDDSREPTLRIAMDSIQVHIVKSVDVATESHDVERTTWQRKDLEKFDF